MRTSLTQLENHKFINQADVTTEEFLDQNIPFILQLVTAYLAQSEHITITDKLMELLLQDLMHTTFKVNNIQNERMEAARSIKAIGYSPQLWRVLNLDENFSIQKITREVSRYFGLSEAAA